MGQGWMPQIHNKCLLCSIYQRLSLVTIVSCHQRCIVSSFTPIFSLASLSMCAANEFLKAILEGHWLLQELDSPGNPHYDQSRSCWNSAEDTSDMSIDVEGAAQREAGDPMIPHLPTDGNSDLVVVTGEGWAVGQCSKEACNAADLDRMAVIVVNNPRPRGTTSKEKYCPSEEEVTGYRLRALPAVFEKEGKKYSLRFVGLDNLCRPGEAENFGRCFEKVAEDGARWTAPSIGHVPTVVHIHAKAGNREIYWAFRGKKGITQQQRRWKVSYGSQRKRNQGR